MVRAEGFEPAEYVVFIGLRRCCDLVVTALFEMDTSTTANPSQRRNIAEYEDPQQEENGLHHQGESGVLKVGLIHSANSGSEAMKSSIVGMAALPACTSDSSVNACKLH